ncbi:hypothetical protein ACH5RR_006454 [Cinchona calisaya]|uniref:non-specific serine/threonine protein kinase n=1 Tax=Cinchona calisaya TaxID=153742 RepID=A0ABD3AP26_9GENT
MVRFLISIHVKILSLVLLILLVHALDIASTKSIRQKEANDQDRVALLEFKSKILHDPCGIINSWNDSIHFCRWNGIQCGHKRKRVTSMNLNDNGLVGYLSPSLGNLSFLRALTLRNNTFRGEIPPQFGQLFRLQVLNLSRNSLEGKIPASLSQCSNLVHLYLSTNMLVGRIPSEFGSLINLESLVTHKNNLTVVIPPSIGNLTSLSLISAAENHLEGNLPEALGQLKRAIGLGENKLSGVIPPSIFNLSQLKVLSVSANQLNGSLPSELGLMLPQLQYLQLSDNQFTGLLPASLSNASELTWIDIGNNAFNGKIAIDFGGLKNLILLAASYNDFGSNGDVDGMNFLNTMTNCSNLVAVSLQDNQLKGILPNNIGNLSSKFLYYLSLSGNLIYGEIPTTLGNLINLESLFLESNQLTGTIPTTIGNLQKLKRLAFADNKLSRKIPEALEIGNLKNLAELDISANRLSGELPETFDGCRSIESLSLADNFLEGSIPKSLSSLREYGLGAEISTCGDVYSFGILLLEMMTGKRPTHDLFIEGLDLHRFVDMAIHHRVIMDIVDPILLHREHKAAVPGSKLEDCLISLLKVGLACSKDLPQDRMNMADVVSTLNSIRDTVNMDQERETGSNACRNP